MPTELMQTEEQVLRPRMPGENFTIAAARENTLGRLLMWLPIFLGLRPVRGRPLLPGLALNSLGVLAALMSRPRVAALFLLAGITFAVHALGLFALPERPAKVR